MRKFASVLAVCAVFGLAACGDSQPSESQEPAGASSNTSTTQASPEQMPKLDTSGSTPVLDFPKTPAPAGLQVSVLESGSGREIESGDVVVAHYVGQVWGEKTPFDSSFSRGAPTSFSLQQVIAGWTQGLSGQKVGSKVILSIPPELGYGPSGGQPAAGIGEKDTIAFYVELLDAYGMNQAGDADATLQVNPADLPVQINGNLGEPITVSVKSGAAQPSGEPVVRVISRGSGQPVGGHGTEMYIQYAMSLWDNALNEATYGSSGPKPIKIGSGLIFDALENIPVGSRVLIEVPASEGGDKKAAPAYAVVVDILGQIPNGAGASH
ncbi:FKBP-type peptidyl-prolyl cis-trans isomerase [Trueperella sp. LYQ143]|uniref:FKBP-type peptidyl-prolyl cis-trans isomerase n=1 Tax=unclassified Trueperella TaxID=2630174 RepID=UPI003983D610